MTRLKCRSFIFALRFNHVITDGIGIVQFMNAMGEMAQGATAPSIPPVWQSELLNARDPPRVTCTHHEFDEVVDTKGLSNAPHGMACCFFIFGSTQISTIRKIIPHHLQTCSRSEILTACIWRCHTIALQLKPDDYVRLIYIVNLRDRFCPPLAIGYYGNAIVALAVLTTVGKLCESHVEIRFRISEKSKG